jgi:hypothetical protein
MNIFITASCRFYDKVKDVKSQLEKMGHKVTPPNGYGCSVTEADTRKMSPSEYQKWKAGMIRTDGKIIMENDAILVLNFEKNGQKNYIGGSVFLEMFKTFDLDKKIFLYNPIPESMLKDEILGFGPIVINGDLTKIK